MPSLLMTKIQGAGTEPQVGRLWGDNLDRNRDSTLLR